ncbi:MAG: UvrD-helicase domain-containing protein, partial [Solirubrobacterales bacterium]
MEERSESKSPALTDAQERVVAHADGPLLVLGLTGSGRTEAISHRLAALAEAGEGALVLASSQATATRIRTRAEEVMEGAFEELVVKPYTAIAARLLSEHATEAGLDPFLESLTAAERLALLLERLDELPLRRHEIRGNAAGLLARIVDRIDALKAAGITAERFREWAEGLGAGQAAEADRDSAAREREFAQIYELHDSMLRAAGTVDGGEAVLELTRLLGERPALAATVAERFPHLIVDELEDACPAERALIELLARGARTTVLSCDDEQGRPHCAGGAGWARETLESPEEVVLEPAWRYGGDVLDAAHAVVSSAGAGA